MKNNLYNILVLVITFVIIIIVISFCFQNSNLEEQFRTTSNFFNDSQYEKERTLLYGSLFLDNLDKQIKNLTDPNIQYDNKLITLLKYSDVVL